MPCGRQVEHLSDEGGNRTLTGRSFCPVSVRRPIWSFCNPNNPTGQLIDRKLLERIAFRCAACGTMLVVDECFRDFLDNPEENSA